MSLDGYRNEGTVERRIGRRGPAPDIPVTWVVPRKATFTLKRSPREHPGHLGEVSLTGAAAVGPSDMEVEVGDVVILRWEGLDSSVRVRHVAPTDEPGLSRHGVEFVVLHPQLRALVVRTIDGQGAPR